METTKTKPTDAVFLRGKRVVLKPINDEHIPLLMKWINDPEVRQYVIANFPKTERDERAWLESLIKSSYTGVVLLIESVEGVPIGTMGIHRIDWRCGVATTGAIIGEKEYWGKGYGTDAKMALLEYAFNTLNLRKICSTVYAFNKRSLAYSLHCGYQVEGRRRLHIFKNGRYWDLIELGLFKEEWLPYWKKYQSKRR